jgi:hypothetical protein
MNRAFSWKDQSAKIFRECFERSLNKENNKCGSDGYVLDSDESDEDDEYDIKTTDNSVFEMAVKERNLVLQKLSVSDKQISRWRELTDIIVSPVLPPRRIKCFNALAQHISEANEKLVKPHSDGVLNVQDQRQDDSSVMFKFQYLIVTERLKVTIEKASNLFHGNENENEMETSVEVSLMPGKCQRQITGLCKGTRNPEFNAVKHFHGFSLEDIHKMCLRIQIKGRHGKVGTLKSLGEVSVALNGFDIVGETCLQEYLNSRIVNMSDSNIIHRKRIH